MSINRVFVEVFNEFNLKTFRDLSLTVILKEFIAVSFSNPFGLVIVPYAIYRVDLSE